MKRLREIAEAATHADWHVGETTDGPRYETQLRVSDQAGMSFVHGGMAEEADAKYVATFDPPTVLALLDVAEAADRALTDRDEDPAVGVALADDLADALARLREVAL